MIPGPDAQRIRGQLLVWWIIWASLLVWLCFLYFFLASGKPLPANVPVDKSLTGLIGVVPLFVSIVIRWLVMPRFTSIRSAFPMFVTGLALAEACGILGIFLGGPYRDILFVLGVLGITQFVPFFAKQYLDPKLQGFIPNN